MKGQEVINHIIKEKMPDREYVRENCKHQSTVNSKVSQRSIWLKTGAVAASLVFVSAMILTFVFNIGDETAQSTLMPFDVSILIEDENIAHGDDPNRLALSVSYIDNYPQPRFYIIGEDIAKIEITTETEFASALDFTKTLDEMFWNWELYYEEIELGGEVYQYIPARGGFFQSLVLIFPEDFNEYDQIWYKWMAHNLYDWAAEDRDTRFHGFNGMNASEIEKQLENMTDEERLMIAAGGGKTSNAGHIILDGYPEELLNDRITITITDRFDNIVIKSILINISSNALGQMVVTASVAD